jgi:multidrug resistance efflux pump
MVRKSILAIFVFLACLLAGFYYIKTSQSSLITHTIELGDVVSFISVSGTTIVDDVIPLSFSRNGTISGIYVNRGDFVSSGTILATIGDTTLQAEYVATLAEVQRTKAIRDELQNGRTTEENAVTEATLTVAENALLNTIRIETARVESARTTLFNSGLSAITKNIDSEALPPTVSGSYNCTAEGTYTIELYQSGTLSGYSYRYFGIESGVGNVSFIQSLPLGSCGLRLQFSPTSNYNNSTFVISIPNTNSPSYATNKAIYDQTVIQQNANIEAARKARDLALNQSTLASAGTRIEKLVAANAAVMAAEARLAQVSYNLSESALRSPKDGVIVDIMGVVGQTIASQPMFTLYAPRKIHVVARIPEKDITRLALQQTAEITFDARPDDTVMGTITFLSPVQTFVNSIPYYEAMIELDTPPSWLRSGMQADVKIITKKMNEVVRIPRIFLQDGKIAIREEGITRYTEPEILLFGNDGYVAIAGISANTEIILEQK